MRKHFVIAFLFIAHFCFAQMPIGLMPSYIAENYGVHFSRKVVYASSWNGWFASPYKDSISLNIDYSTSHTYTTDTTKFKRKIQKIKDALKPFDISIENEELLTGNIITYCNELKAASHIATVTNGGLTAAELGYWYYRHNPQDSLFFRYNVFQKDAYLNGEFDTKIAEVDYALVVYKSLNIQYVNVHYYIGYPSQTDGLIRMFKFLSAWTNKQLTCNEAGIYRVGLLPNVIQVAKESGMKYLILYSGLGTDGSGKALPISKTDFENTIY